MRAEMVDIGRAQAELSGVPAGKGLSEWAAGLSGVGRYAEAAGVMTELVAAVLPDGPCDGALGADPVEGARALARILMDRSTFHAAARDLGPALDDFRQALRHLGEEAG